MKDSFDINLAQKIGVYAAIVYDSLLYWIRTNKANGSNFRDGRTWSFNSVKKWKDYFPYLTEWQIRTALKTLLDIGLIRKGNYNKTAYDRTSWYALEDEESALKGKKNHLRNSQMELSQTKNRSAQGREPIPTSNPDNKPAKNKGVVDRAEDVLGLDLQIVEQKKLFMREIEQALRPHGKEVNTFTKITKWLVLKCQRRELPVSIFKDAIEWARQAKLSTATNKKGLFVAKVKKETGYRPEKYLLGGP